MIGIIWVDLCKGLNKIMFDKLDSLKKISELIGNNVDLVQGAGGNTSLKDGNTLWVKASGCWLSDAMSKDIFVPVNLNNVLDSINNGDIKNISPINNSSLRPSIETTLHALMPQKYIIHVHAVNTLSIAVLSNGKQYIEELLKGLNWAWVPYAKPGIELARAVEKELKNNNKVDVVILANHGLVVGDNNIEEALDLVKNIEKKICRISRKNFAHLNNKNNLISIVNNSQYRLVKYSVANLIAYDKLALEIINKRALYPDHIVFLGVRPIKNLSIENFKDTLKILNDNVVIVHDFGVIVKKDIGENSELMLYCLANVLLRLQPNDELRHLSPNDEMQLMDWDAEKYRQSVQR